MPILVFRDIAAIPGLFAMFHVKHCVLVKVLPSLVRIPQFATELVDNFVKLPGSP